ncbi:MAG: peptide ABC transporter substrate-binding protein [Bradymonadia bacterium]
MRRTLMLAAVLSCVFFGCDDKGSEPVKAKRAVKAKKADGGKSGDTGKDPKGAADGIPRKEKNPRIFHRSLGEPEYLDPGLISESEGGIVTHDTFEGLYNYGPTHKDWPNGVAEGHTISEDGLTWTFTLRKNAKWSDGSAVTAGDFAYAWKRVLNPETASRYASILWVIEGAKAYNESTPETRADLAGKVGIKAVDDHTLEVKLVAPLPFFNQLTAFYTFMPVKQSVVEQHGDKWSRPENIVSNGPWMTTEWKSKQRITLEANPHYWDKPAVPFDKIIYHIVQESEPAHNAFLAHDIDFLESRVPPAVLPRYIQEKQPDLKISPYVGVYYFLFNVEKKPLDSLKVRQALNLAIDKGQIGKYVVKGQQEPASSIVHPALEDLGYKKAQGEGYNPEKARKLLAEAGYPDGKGFPRLKLSYNTLEGHKLIAQYIQEQWRKNLGVEIDLENMEWKVLIKKQNEKDYDISRLAWIGDYLDPMTFLDLWETTNTNNRTGWSSAEYDKIIDEARKATTVEARYAALNKAEAMYVENLPSLPIYYYMKYDMVKPWLKGYNTHLQGVHLSRYFKIEQ